MHQVRRGRTPEERRCYGVSCPICVCGGGGGGGCRTGSPIENNVAWRPWRRGTGRLGPFALRTVTVHYVRCPLPCTACCALRMLVLCTACRALPHTMCCVLCSVRRALCLRACGHRCTLCVVQCVVLCAALCCAAWAVPRAACCALCACYVMPMHPHLLALPALCVGRGGGGFGTRPWWLALLACGGAYWPLAFEPSAMTSTHPYYCGHSHCRGHAPSWVGI